MMGRAASTRVLIALWVLARGARAGDAVTAEALFREGRTLMKAGDFASACPKLQESYAQDPATGTLLSLALCEEQQGQTASAWESYSEVISRSKQEGRADREQLARARVADLETKLSHLTIIVDASAAAVPGLIVKRDDAHLGEAAWGAAVPLDPGEHVVEVTAPRKQEWKTTVTVGPSGDSKTVRIPSLVDEPVAPAPGPVAPEVPVAPPPIIAAPEPSPPVRRSPLRTIGLVAGGAGVATLGIAGLFGLRASGAEGDSNANGHCSPKNECDSFGGAKRDDAKSAADVSTALLVTGAVLTATGVTLFLVGRPTREAPTSARVEATPVLARNAATMVVRGQF
jgi:hypothetical protein